MSTIRHSMIILILLGFEGVAAFSKTPCDAEDFVVRHAWRLPAEVTQGDERRFGSSGVLVHEDVLAIATDRGPDGTLISGRVRLYDRHQPAAEPLSILMAPERSWPDGFGFTIRGFDRRLLIGAPADSETNWGAGRAWLYSRTDDGWVVERSFADPSAETDAAFGHAVAIGDDTIVIGAPRSDRAGRDAGCVFIFERVNHRWRLGARLVAPDAENSDFFGSSLALNGSHLAIGAWGDDDHGEKTGSVWCYEKRGDHWSMRQKLVPDRLQSRALFGSALLFHEHELLVSAPGTREDRGAVYVFTGRTGRWELIDQITDPATQTGDRFGDSMDASSGLLVIGAPEACGVGSSSGMVTMYRRSGWGWSLIDHQSIRSEPSEQSTRFGFNVSTEGGTIIVGRSDQADETPAPFGAWLIEEVTSLAKDDETRPEGIISSR